MVVTSTGKLEMHIKLLGGKGTVTARLRELGHRLYEHIGSPHGDMYRIVRTTGDLQLHDNYGLIRTAKRLENVARAGDCLK
jgi:hypothetical protein